MQNIKISGGKSVFAVRNAYASTNVAIGVQEVDTFTFPALASAADGDYCVAYDAVGNGWAVALDTAGSAANTPTGAVWVTIAAARKVYLNVSTTTTAAQMAAAVVAGFNALVGFTAAITLTNPGGAPTTGVFTSVGYATNTAPATKTKNDSGAGSVSVAQTTAGVPYTALTQVNCTSGLSVTKTPDLVNRLEIYDNSGKTLALAYGAAGAETFLCWIPPGGLPMTADVIVPLGVRLAVRAVDAAATTNQLLILGVQ